MGFWETTEEKKARLAAERKQLAKDKKDLADAIAKKKKEPQGTKGKYQRTDSDPFYCSNCDNKGKRKGCNLCGLTK